MKKQKYCHININKYNIYSCATMFTCRHKDPHFISQFLPSIFKIALTLDQFDSYTEDDIANYVVIEKNYITGDWIFLSFLNKRHTKFLESLLKQEEIFIRKKDITNDLLFNKYPNHVLKKMSIGKYRYHFELFQYYQRNRLDLDTILDKISKSGVESLNILEKQYLQTF